MHPSQFPTTLLLCIVQVGLICQRDEGEGGGEACFGTWITFKMTFAQLQALPEGPPLLLPVPWLVSQASFLLELMLQQCRTQYELGKVLQLFADTDTVLPHGKDSFLWFPVSNLLPAQPRLPLEICFQFLTPGSPWEVVVKEHQLPSSFCL